MLPPRALAAPGPHWRPGTAPAPLCIASLVIVISVMLFWRGKRKKENVPLPSFDRKFPKVSYNDLARSTEGFSTSKLIGKGRYSSVYQGSLFEDRIVVAVKVFSLDRIVGNDFKALVYKFMPQGDLHTLLHSVPGDGSTSTLSHITLAQRLSIVVDIADAMEYLHHNNQGTIVHCDLKPSNILLDDNMIAHVGDFGLAMFKVDSAVSSFGDSLSASSMVIKGTIGYVAPECATSTEVTIAGDVYSFGIVILEIILRRRPTDDMFKDGLNIVKFVETNFPESILRIIDPDLLEDEHDVSEGTSVGMKQNSLECILSVLKVGLCCANPSPNERMDMHGVAARLHGIKEAYLRGN
ncbi:unnamed protein product [Miscanthus lutarioriparius]|uniref:non-specific serine/threonine protein kinase n=1 Tax=Miscanthus lutarioriparius TaxID=422564 RepID=A0A811Q240_9POAL|nr:unnamed protein product [Miscanthus lutarioriparius]